MTKSFTVTVKDTTAPVITTVPANVTDGGDRSDDAGDLRAAATATDAVTASPTITYSVPSGSGFAVGTTTVTVTATDAAGNHSSKTFTVTIKDTTPPVVSAVNITARGEPVDAATRSRRLVHAGRDGVGSRRPGDADLLEVGRNDPAVRDDLGDRDRDRRRGQPLVGHVHRDRSGHDRSGDRRAAEPDARGDELGRREGDVRADRDRRDRHRRRSPCRSRPARRSRSGRRR